MTFNQIDQHYPYRPSHPFRLHPSREVYPYHLHGHRTSYKHLMLQNILPAMACFSSPLLLLLLPLLFSPSSAQQPYINNVQLDCYNTNASSALGYSCSSPQSSCSSFLTFRSYSPYLSAALISFLLSADAGNISHINSLPSDVSPLLPNDLLLIPIPCSCSDRNFYQHNASYTLKFLSETYLTVANDTYQGLSTCQALMSQNPIDSRKLVVGDKLLVPLRCACPSLNQTRAGIKYLLSYLVIIGDDIPTIAQTFRADYQSILFANNLSEKSTIYPLTTLLIPLSAEPTRLSSPPSPAPDVFVSPPPADTGGSSHKGVIAGVGAGIGLLVLLGALGLFFCLRRRRRQRPQQHQPETGEPVPEGAEYSELPSKTTSLPSQTTPLASNIRDMLDWMTVYKFVELQSATGDFDEEHRIRGSVYRGVINGDDAAIKRLKGDVSNEISILKQISHSSLIRLSGFCLHQGNTYMVYEYAEMGSLSDWLHHQKSVSGSSCLTWKQRIQIACDVADGLNYLHNYTTPPYIHKNLKSSNVLLGRDFRAKVANFGLARAVEEEGVQQLTRHVVGTQGYMAPEYLEHGVITPKLDVFAFGVVLLEILSGKEATFAREGEEKVKVLLSSAIEDVLCGEDVRSKLRGFLDRCLRDDYPFDLAFAMAELAKRCVAPDAASRPAMNELLVSLSAICNSTLDWEPEEVTRSHSGSAIYTR